MKIVVKVLDKRSDESGVYGYSLEYRNPISSPRYSLLRTCRTIPLGVRTYSQYWENVFKMRSVVVPEEKFREAKKTSGIFLKVEVSVMVFPDPGGPQRIIGFLVLMKEIKTSTCLTVSLVVMTRSVAVTLLLSISILGTLSDQASQSPSLTLGLKAIKPSSSPPAGSAQSMAVESLRRA